MRMGPKLPIIGDTTAREATFLFHALAKQPELRVNEALT
jgi:hypothetical protein